MQRIRWITGVLSCALIATTLHADPAADSFAVSGNVQTPGDWNIARIRKDLSNDITTVSYSDRHGKHSSLAVPLIAVLKAAGVTAELEQNPTATPNAKHPELRFAVTVQGSDGYFAVFSMAELMSDVGNHHVWLALDMDGKALSDTEGPMKLIVPDDQKPARWVHAVQTISVVKVEPPATQPAPAK